MNLFTKLFLVGASALLARQASAQVLLDNFENTRLVAYPNNSGALTQTAANPGSNAVNSSSTCASYGRNAGVQYDYLVIKPSTGANFANVSDYSAGTKRISMKFRSPAAGVRIELVLQNSPKSNTNIYPNGKYAGDFVATTTVANAWETLTFTFTAAAAGNFDPSVGATDIDQMTMLIAPNTNDGATYYIDDINGPEAATGGTNPTGQPVASILLDNFETTRLLAYPNTSGALTQTAANPAANAVNSSPTCASYGRNAGVQYDYLVLLPSAAPNHFGNVSDFSAGTQRISVKFYSPAAGVPVQLVLQNSPKSNTNIYPNGKYAGDFNATTTVANAWETLTFTFAAGTAGNFDPTVTANDVDQMTMLIAPNTNGGATYYIDDVMGPDYIRSTTPPTGVAVSQLYDNYEGTRAIKYIAYKTSGGFTRDTLNNVNPAPAANPSAHVMRYTRSTNQYDALVVHPMGAALADVTPFRANTLHMTMKVFSPAPGILFQITLQDSTVANGANYPAGRNSEYQATTTATNAWETLTFNFTNSPSTTPSTGLNEIVLLIAPGTTDMRKVYIDDWTGPSLVGYTPTATRAITSVDAAFAPVYPNPTHGVAHLPVNLVKTANVSLAVYDMMGRRVQDVITNQTRPAGQHTLDVNTAPLAPGLYTCRLVVNGVVMTRPLSVQ
jgi:hypothetical protein